MLKDLYDKLDLNLGLKLVAANDLLPPREDDKVSGEVGKRFVEYLYKQIEDRRYEPTPASFVQVPKPGLTSRPGALLTLTDRVIYEALVELLRPRLSKYLLDKEIIFWPREIYCDKRWSDFENAPLVAAKPYIVFADVSGFYESIDHYQLDDELVLATGQRELARAVRTFLSKIMGRRRGLPQGLNPSDTLATVYLQQVDAAILRGGFDYWRHGDDMRIAVESISRAREAISLVEEELRSRGLLLNASKVLIQSRENYEQALKSGEQTLEQVKTKLFEEKVEKVVSDQDELIAAMKHAQLDEQWEWNLFYHHNISIVEVIEQIRGHLQPTAILVAEKVFSMAVARAPGTSDPFPKELFHFLISRSLVQLAAARSPSALPYVETVLAKFPEKTEVICQYLKSISTTNPADVVKIIENLLQSSLFTTPWQQAWFFRLLGANHEFVSEDILRLLAHIASSSSTHWLARVEAMKVLARTNQLSRELLASSWNSAPPQYRCDLLVVAAMVPASEGWAKKFMLAARLDPVEQVVAAHLKS